MVAARRREDRDVSVVSYWPRGGSAEMFRCHDPVAIISGPAGTGKTLGDLWKMHLCALKYPGMRGIILRKVQEDLTASALVTYQERVLGSGNFGVRPYGGSKFTPASYQYPNGSVVLVGGMDKSDKVMSREYDIALLIEATEFYEEDVDKLSTRMRWGVMPYQQIYGDVNPQGPGHWIYKWWQAGRLTMFWSTHKDNPVLWDADLNDWTGQGKAYMTRLDNLTGFRRDRLRDGKWTAAEGAVYPMFDRQAHVKPLTPDDLAGWARTLWIDVGTRNPTVVLTAYIAGDRIHIGHEVYRRGMSSDDMVDTVAMRYQETGATHAVIDPSAAALILSLQARGVVVRKGVNDVQNGILAVTSRLADLTIDPGCVETINEFESYRYPDGARANSDTPVKENDHSMDSIRYGVMDQMNGIGPDERLMV